MKVQLLSDIHLELKYPWPKLHPDADLIVLAGDIASGEDSIQAAREMACAFGGPVVWVAGNHEFYRRSYQEMLDYFEHPSGMGMTSHVGMAKGGPSVTQLTDTSAVIHGVRFVGGTLWTDFRLYEDMIQFSQEKALRAAGMRISDFSIIHSQRDLKHVFVEAFEKTRAAIAEVLATPFDGPTVVVTHHAPSAQSIHERYRVSQRWLDVRQPPARGVPEDWKLNPAFASNLDDLVAQADFWFHGHIHDSADYRIGKCRVVSNPRGYYRRHSGTFENATYSEDLLIDVPCT